MQKELTKEMLFNYFEGKATTLQKRMIDELVKDPRNKELFFECLAIWESQNLQYHADTEAALSRHLQKFEVAERVQVPVVEIQPKRWWPRMIAAASVLIAVFLTGYLFQDNIFYRSTNTAYGETKSMVLEDGSQVVLNSNSQLKVPRFGFGDYTRKVFLKGEGNFSVRHLSGNQKFVVKTADGTDVVVLGTEFTVYARQRGTKVILNKGKIQLNYLENMTTAKQLIMQPGELVTIDKKGNAELTKTQHPEKFSAWKDHRYVFEKISLEELCILFDENFGVHVTIADPDISAWTVSGAFVASNAEELLEALAESSGLNYKKENNKVIIQSLAPNQPVKN